MTRNVFIDYDKSEQKRKHLRIAFYVLSVVTFFPALCMCIAYFIFHHNNLKNNNVSYSYTEFFNSSLNFNSKNGILLENSYSEVEGFVKEEGGEKSGFYKQSKNSINTGHEVVKNEFLNNIVNENKLHKSLSDGSFLQKRTLHLYIANLIGITLFNALWSSLTIFFLLQKFCDKNLITRNTIINSAISFTVFPFIALLFSSIAGIIIYKGRIKKNEEEDKNHEDKYYDCGFLNPLGCIVLGSISIIEDKKNIAKTRNFSMSIIK